MIERIEADRRFKLKAEKEVEYYRQQTMTATPIKWLGNFLAVTMSIGAVFAAMNTMYAAVGSRTREIGTLRVLGFRRRAVIMALLLEGGFLALDSTERRGRSGGVSYFQCRRTDYRGSDSHLWTGGLSDRGDLFEQA